MAKARLNPGLRLMAALANLDSVFREFFKLVFCEYN